MGNLREQKLYRWSKQDVGVLRKLKKRHYRKGRGRKPAAERMQHLKSKELRRARNRSESPIAILEGIIDRLEALVAGLGMTPTLPFIETTEPNPLENAWRALRSALDELRKERSFRLRVRRPPPSER